MRFLRAGSVGTDLPTNYARLGLCDVYVSIQIPRCSHVGMQLGLVSHSLGSMRLCR